MDCFQLQWTMASETLDQIDWPLILSLHTVVPPVLHLLGAEAGNKSQDLLQPVDANKLPSQCQANALSMRWSRYACL